jgi:alpha-1,2-mannosyltransferase
VRFGEPAGLAVTAVVGLLVSPISWSHHWVWWMVPAILLTVEAWRRRSVELAMWTLVWSLPFFVAPFWFVPHHDHRAMPHGLLQQLAASAYVWVGLAGLGVVWVWMLRDRHRIVVPEMSQPSPAQ